MRIKRIPTNIKGLDEILHGGLFPSSSYLIAGAPGTGKTVLSLQFLVNCAKRNEKCLYINLTEPELSVKRNASSFGWDFSNIIFIDFSKILIEDLGLEEYSIFSPSEVESESIWKKIYNAVEKYSPERLVIDSATFLKYLSVDEYQFNRQVQYLINYLSSKNCLSLFIYDENELLKDKSFALAADGVFILRNTLSKNRIIDIRTIEVSKFRGSAYIGGRHFMKITENGIVIYPHRIEKAQGYSFKRELISSGIKNLDDLLNGGIYSGTANLITGPSGVGKSTLTIHFLTTAVKNGKKAVLYSFEETTHSFLTRCNNINIPAEKYYKNGSLIIKEINPLDCTPHEFFEMIKEDKNRGITLFAIDSLRGYNIAMDEFGNIIADIQNIVNFCRYNNLTLFIISEHEKITGDLQLTEYGISYIADNVILIRYAEIDGEVIKIINCLKKRISKHEQDFRIFEITNEGIKVGRKLDYLRGLFTGIPTN